MAQAHFAVPQTVVLDELQPAVAEAFQRSLQCLSQAGRRLNYSRYGVRRTGRIQCQRWFHRVGVLALASGTDR
ncbi:hypothetical protein M8494_26240 [Serratia ureilytica]